MAANAMFYYAVRMSTVTEVRTGEQLRARRRRRMADDIELIALRAFAERGIDAVTVDDIADAADISRRTFFRYFASKDDILHGNPERQLEIVRAALDSAPANASPSGLARRILLALTSEYDDRKEALLLRKKIAAKDPDAFARGSGRHAGLVDGIVDALTSHLGTDPETDMRPRVYIHAGLGALQAVARTWLTTGARGSLKDLTAESLALIGLK